MHHVKGYLRDFLGKNLITHLNAGDYVGATNDIMGLGKSNNGRRLLNWMTAAFCLPKMDGEWPDIDGDIYDELSGYDDTLSENSLFIKGIIFLALARTVKD